MRYLLWILMVSYATAEAAEKPNILFIAIDDMNDWTGYLGGHPQALTPNLDRLAQKGINFCTERNGKNFPLSAIKLRDISRPGRFFSRVSIKAETNNAP